MVLNEHAKSVKDFRSQLYRMTITKDAAFYHFQPKRAELIHCTVRLRGHRLYYDPFQSQICVAETPGEGR